LPDAPALDSNELNKTNRIVSPVQPKHIIFEMPRVVTVFVSHNRFALSCYSNDSFRV
jgi:hypothetical protein